MREEGRKERNMRKDRRVITITIIGLEINGKVSFNG